MKDNEKTLWIHSVPKDVVTATPPEERKRQECIYELIYTEEDYVKDLEYVEKVKSLLCKWMTRIFTKSAIALDKAFNVKRCNHASRTKGKGRA